MSFILDALKKSESDRQRQAGPALFEVRVAAPRSRFPMWGIVLAVLLAVNAAVLGAWLLLRAPHAEPPLVVASGGAPAAAAAPAPAPAPLRAAATLPSTPVNAPAAASVPRDPELAALDPVVENEASPADDEPAIEQSPSGRGPSIGPAPAVRQPLAGSHVRTEATGLPTRDQLHSPEVASLPELRLDLHVYDPDPAKRFVLINMHRLHEGDSLPEGARLERITEAGAELEYRGSRFLLPHE